MQFASALFTVQSFTPLYMKMDSQNFVDHETDRVAGMIIILFMALQLAIIKSQQTYGPRWFIPKRFRRNPYSYDYFHTVPERVLARARSNSKEASEDDEMCVICMNYIHFEVDGDGALVNLNAP